MSFYLLAYEKLTGFACSTVLYLRSHLTVVMFAK